MAKKIIIWLIAILVVAAMVYTIPFIYKLFSTQREIVEVKFPQLEESLFLKNEKRGLNYEMTAISASSRKKIKNDEEESFIYKSGETIFYKATNDTLVIYTMNKINYPKNLNSKIFVKQIEITNPKFIELKNNYKNLGLRQFPE